MPPLRSATHAATDRRSRTGATGRLPGTAAAPLAAAASQWRTAQRAEVALAGTLVSIGTALRLGLMLRGWPVLNSDEAIIGLMARHILQGERPIFYYGQHYLGALEAYITAAFFAVFGSSTFVLHLSMLPLVVGFLVVTYLVARYAFGVAVALLTLAYLALGPAFALLRETSVIGGYQELLVLGGILLLLVYLRLRQPRPLPRGRAEWERALGHYALIGLVGGLGIWSDSLMIAFLGAALLALVVGRFQELRRWPALALLAGLVIGAWPLLIYNLQHGGITLAELSAQSRASASQPGPFPPLLNWLQQAGATISVALPAVFGSPHVCMGPADLWASYPRILTATHQPLFGVCSSLNTLFAIGVLACFAVIAWQLIAVARSWWSTSGHWVMQWVLSPIHSMMRRGVGPEAVRRIGTGSTSWRGRLTLPSRGGSVRRPLTPEQRAQLWLRAMLLLTAVVTLGLYTLSRAVEQHPFTAARYLLGLYVTVPLVFGALWQVAAPASSWARERLTPLVLRWSGAGSSAPRIGALSFAGRTSQRGGQRGAGPAGRFANASVQPGHLPGRPGRRPAWPHWVRRAAAALAVGGLLLLLGFSAYGAAATIAFSGDTTLFAQPEPQSDRQLMDALSAHGVTRFVSDYWTCYRLALESGERLRCAVRDSVDNTLTRNGAVNRYLPYLLLIERTPHPAYIFGAGSTQDTTFDAWAASQHLPHTGYARFVVDGYAIFYYPAGQG